MIYLDLLISDIFPTFNVQQFIADASLEEMQEYQGGRSPGAPRSPGRCPNKARFSADIEYLMRQHKVKKKVAKGSEDLFRKSFCW